MSDASFSEDELEVYDVQSPGSDRFLSPLETLESMDARSFQIDSYLSPLKQFVSYIHSHENNCSSDGRQNLTNTQSSESYCSSSPEKYGEVYAQLREKDSSSPHKKLDLTDSQSSESDCSYFPVDIQSLESDCSSPDKKHESIGTQLPESIPSFSPSEKCTLADTCSLKNGSCSSSSYGNHKLADIHLHENVCSLLPENLYGSYTQSLEMDCSSFPVDIQSLESDCSSPDKRHESTGAQLPESIPSFNPSEKCTLADTCSLKNGCCSSSSNGNHNLADTHLHENACSLLPENLHGSYTQSLEMDCSSFPNRKCNLVGARFHKIGGSSPNKKHNLSDTLSPEGDCTSLPENHYKSYSQLPETDFSSPAETLMPESNCYPSPHRKHKLSYDGFSDNDCSRISCVKCRLISDRSFKIDLTSSAESVSGHSSDSDWFPSHLRHGNDELPLNILLKLASGCEKMLRKIIRTAYQFTRHSHREKLSLKDLERAFKIHNVNIRSDDSDCLDDKIGSDSAGGGDESQPFTCSGKWLRKLEDKSFNE
ncbi:hypothetical protein AVEN_423-1 [Araneus ventricosus]|uniref:TATA box binding protein associated factor (TAF) histone-like fold domain-containing protein n=1 Tax=Araneus ventricosus TaxID=182803 RepID=A0A4Y2PXA2_ARAVE|nr:hypothetical protein AVEN_423-1 [Araneus ventricosus]